MAISDLNRRFQKAVVIEFEAVQMPECRKFEGCFCISFIRCTCDVRFMICTLAIENS